MDNDFNPRPPRGGRRGQRRPCAGHHDFNPRPPRGGRRPRWCRTLRRYGFQSTPPARGATVEGLRERGMVEISIHAPREGGDPDRPLYPPGGSHFNPRPPRGGRLSCSYAPFELHLFQSTPPARGATRKKKTKHVQRDFNPRPPRGGRRGTVTASSVTAGISIHAPREGGDWCRTVPILPPCYFNPRPPRGGRPDGEAVVINAVRFQSTPPARGATLLIAFSLANVNRFQSTPPARGATDNHLAVL